MDFEKERRNVLERAADRPGDLKVDPSFDVKPDPTDMLLEHPSCHESPDTKEDDFF